jgi:hypothetical protein
MDIGYEAAQDVGEAVVFGDSSPEVRLLRVAQGFPLSSDVVLVVPGFPRMFEEKALDRSDFGQGAKGHVRSLFHEYTVFSSGLQRSGDRMGAASSHEGESSGDTPGIFTFLLNFRAFPPFMNRIHICNLLIIKAIMNARIFSVDFR